MSELALTRHIDHEMHLDATQGEESAWVERARRGDIDAFDALMTRYEGRLLRFLTGLVGDTEVARELCQDTFMAAYGALPRAKGEMRISAWLHTIALNRARSHHRKRKFRIFVSIDDHDVREQGRDMQDSIADGEIVQKTLGRLPKQYAEVLLLQLTGGLSCKEIAGILSCSEGAVKVRLMRARESFKRFYEEEVREPCTT
ncbi:MAG: RNA polymerase sigma factor [Chloroflexota bacterium]